MFPPHHHRGPAPGALLPQRPTNLRLAPPSPIQYKYYKYLINTLINLNVPLPGLARIHFFFFFGFKRKRRKNLLPTSEPCVKLFLKQTRRGKKIAVAQQLIGEEKRCSASARGLFMYYPYFYELQRMDWNPATPPQCSILRLWRKNKKLKEDEFLSVLWIINLKNTAKSRRASCHDFSCRLSLYPSDQLELFEFQHDSRLYKGISVHVCIYLFMCNLMGIVNMVRLLKLLSFLFIWCLLF